MILSICVGHKHEHLQKLDGLHLNKKRQRFCRKLNQNLKYLEKVNVDFDKFYPNK
ncbi:hypothetical protein C7972_13115 [Arenibacter sp. ARW7G5Y1]|nr:hypothetical protein C7972_13115 [Arenibacter sp. ARW7G5Y1]